MSASATKVTNASDDRFCSEYPSQLLKELTSEAMSSRRVVTIFLWCEMFSGHFERPWPEHWEVPWRRQPQDCHHVFRKRRPELWTRARKPWVQVNLLFWTTYCVYYKLCRYYRKTRTSLGVPAGRRGSRTPSKPTDENFVLVKTRFFIMI